VGASLCRLPEKSTGSQVKPIIDKALLAEFRSPGYCEKCFLPCFWGRDPHHLFGRGMGGGKRFDYRLFLLSLCRFCHDDAHAGKITRAELVAIVAAREGVTAEFIEEENRHMRADNGLV
jgi:hypothetical protein